MKKYIYALIALSIAGAAVSGILFFQHYYPDSQLPVISCGDALENPCLALGQSRYSVIFGLPLAAYGLLFYLFTLFTVLIADYAEGELYGYAVAILLPLSALSLAADLALGIILIVISTFCPLCFATYIISILIFAALFMLCRIEKGWGMADLAGNLRGIISIGAGDHFKKAFISAFMLFAVLLAFAVFSASFNLRLKTEDMHASDAEVSSFIKDFYNYAVEKPDLPDSKMIIGNPDAPVTVTVFTDFLCSHCYELFKMEKFLLSKYRGRIKFVYYIYPLDKECNPGVSRTVYKNSCLASRAIIAASDKGLFREYLVAHFSAYEKYSRGYEKTDMMENYRLAAGKAGLAPDESGFSALIDSETVSDRLFGGIAAGEKLKIRGTPAIFIAGRRLGGLVPREILEGIIDRELAGR
ncbi:MAG: thioredoxin domain-containing protein [Spirochaetes bacterium]|jgi:protein-disulfide isomerase/uncharacterized membrane protein|nr:thioredoxin domain-containing protein [Spirochaetota bacterium]